MSPFALVRNVPLTLKTSLKGGLVGKDTDEPARTRTSGSDGASQKWRSQAGGCITAAGISYGVITQKNRTCRTVLWVIEINQAIADAVGHHVEIGELPHVAAEAAYIADIHNRAISNLTLNTNATVVSHGLGAVPQQDAAETGWGSETPLGQKGAVKYGRCTTPAPCTTVEFLEAFNQGRVRIEVSQNASPLPWIVVHSKSTPQRRLPIAEHIIGKAEARSDEDTFKINQSVGISIDAGDDHSVWIGPISGRNKIPNQDYRQSVSIRITCRVRNRVKGRLPRLRVLACSSIIVGLGNCVVLK